ncbi:hypothetical protein [Streptomyces sp. DH37]|uniref:hypothetical protein n=1 Tax=Streptomyces sp. DH37 TaxID=3040122 RepID=UPI002441BDBC|nr:hypothetical protein [Streptomyces sp. DH37]MDG9704073.1 hypothetical protein [Streptomyces sp. DH37]
MADHGRIDVAAMIARQCIEATLRVKVEVHDADGKQGAHDLKFRHEERDCAAEVKLLVDPKHREAEAKASQIGYTQDSSLKDSWTAYMEPGRRWNRALQQLPKLLAEIEALDTSGLTRPWRRGKLSEKLERLGVDDLLCVQPTEKHPPGYYVMSAPWGGGVPSIDHAVSAACSKLAGPEMAKIRKQLSAAEADERHAFLLYGWEYLEAIPLSRDEEFPTVPPELPEEVDAIWLTSILHESPVVAWLPEQGWIRAANLGTTWGNAG